MQNNIQNSMHRSKTFITKYHIWISTSIIITLFAGINLAFAPEKLKLIILLIIPAVLACFFILRNPYYGIYLFFFYSYLRPYDFIPALRVLRLTMLIEVVTLIAWLLKLVISKAEIKWSMLSWCFLAFMGVIGITVVTAENNFFAYEIFIEMMIFFVIFIIATNVVDSLSRLNKIVWLLLLIHFYFALKGINIFLGEQHLSAGQYTSGRVSHGYIGDENDFALVINLMIPFAFFGLFYFKGKVKFICAALLIIFVLAVISSFSRGGFVGLASVMLYCILNSKRKLLSLGAVISIFIAMFLFAPSSYWDEAETIKEIDKGTANARINYWKAGFRMFVDHPIVGVGAGNGGMHMPMYLIESNNPNREWGRTFHGVFPQVIAELGILGSFFYFSMIIIAFKLLYRIKNRKVGEGGDNFSQYMANSIIGSLIAYFACSTFLSTAYYPHLWATYTFTVILVLNQNTNNNNKEQVDKNNNMMAENKLVS